MSQSYLRSAFTALVASSTLTLPSFAADDDPAIPNVTVTSSRANLIGVADTASQGSVTQQELELRPVYRVGQLLETVPGLVVTTHSGEGKANQYLLRGFNLDHGVDFANFIDDMPVNRPTNAHGEGYSDLNFVMPQILAGVDFTKGPYFASLGDFGAVGSEHMRLLNDLPTQISTSVGTLGDQDVFAGGTYHFDDGSRLMGAADVSHLDGPYSPPDNYRTIKLATRLSRGTDADGYSVTAMYFKGQGRNSTDVPQRAITSGMIGEFGELDPSDGNRSTRWSLSGHYGTSGDDWVLATNAFYVHSTMTLWNNFTHFLNDPINGDQEQQNETRTILGGGAAYTIDHPLGSIPSETTVGLQERYDTVYVDRRHTLNRVALDYCNDGDGDYAIGKYACTASQVQLNDVAPYISNTTHWLSWMRTILGVREDYYSANEQSLSSPFSGSTSQLLFQPKGTVAFGPWYDTELYASAGRGFHSDDARGVLGGLSRQGTQLAVGQVSLMAKATGEEIGIRNASIPDLQIQLALFREDFSSELRYNQDAGQDQATAPSRRKGVELSAQYHPYPWLELNTDLAAASAHYFKNAATLADIYGITGSTSIADAPEYTVSFGVLVDNLGPWFGGLQERVLGPSPLTDGPSNPKAAGYSETNIDVGYKVSDAVKLQLSVYNLFDQREFSAEYYYATALNAQEVAKYGTAGVTDYQVHYLEPLSARLSLTVLF